MACFSPDIDVRRKALNIAMEMISSRNVQEVVLVLKKELVKTHDQEYEKVCQADCDAHRDDTDPSLAFLEH
jgi:vesicle coat complex subunit